MLLQIREILQADQKSGSGNQVQETTGSFDLSQPGTTPLGGPESETSGALKPSDAASDNQGSKPGAATRGLGNGADPGTGATVERSTIGADASAENGVDASGEALASSVEPKEVEVVQEDKPYRPIMWCAPALLLPTCVRVWMFVDVISCDASCSCSARRMCEWRLHGLTCPMQSAWGCA
jgi:hypothetical protein